MGQSDQLTLILLGCVFFVAFIICIIAWCYIFKKANIHPWKLFVPFYGSYLAFDIADSKGYFFWSVALLLFVNLSQRCGSSCINYSSSESILLYDAIVGIPSIIWIILHIIFMVRLARCFGKKGWFALGLILLHPIFLCILGFGSAKYNADNYNVDNTEKGKVEEYHSKSMEIEQPEQKKKPYVAILKENQMRCAKCGTIQNKGRNVCWGCGARFLDEKGTVEEIEMRTINDNSEEDAEEATIETQSLEEITENNEQYFEDQTHKENTVIDSEKQEVRFCRYCGFKLLENSQFCSHCGKEV